MTTQTREDYLKAIFCLNEKGIETIKSKDIVKALKVSKSAVSEMLKKLKKEKLIKMMPYSNIFLSPKGFEIAKKTAYKHRVIEIFLKEILKFEDENLHKEAHKLEHSMSDEVTKKIREFLKIQNFAHVNMESLTLHK